jgi:hypothetical protein
MSIATSEKLQNITNTWIIRVGSVVMSIALMFSTWFLSQAWDRINNMEKSIRSLEISMATAQSNRFTSMDWITNKTILDSDKLAIDRRVMRIEETNVAVKDSLIRIEAAMNKHLESTAPPISKADP